MNRIKPYKLFKENVDMSIFDWEKSNAISEYKITDYDNRDLSLFIGETFIKIDCDKEIIRFYTKSGRIFSMYHIHDCTELVVVDDIEGDINDIIGYPILVSEESTNSNDLLSMSDVEYTLESFTWTFYRFATQKGWVIIKWFGESNGYYSESVDIFERMPKSLSNLRSLLMRELSIGRYELEERLSEFNVIRNVKVDMLSLEQLYQFYDKEVPLEKLKSLVKEDLMI